MYNRILKLSFLLFFISIYFISTAQKKFSVTIHWPKGLLTKKMGISYGNGIKWTTIEPVIDKNEITITDSFFSKYATISINIDSNNYHFPNYNNFYIAEKPSKIVLYPQPEDPTKEGKKYATTNAYDVSEIDKSFRLYIDKNDKERINYVETIGLDSTYFSIFQKLILKKLEFITLHKNTYFAFELFKNEVIPISFMKPDSVLDGLMNFYETTFSQEFKQSIEGAQVVQVLHDKWLGTHLNVVAPDFIVKDINGQTVSLKDFKGRYVLLNLWATWCGPCVAELPAIRLIHEKYPVDSLCIISVSYDRDKDSMLFIKTLQDFKMDWINIFKDQGIGNKYGRAASLPQLFLINKQAIIIYNRSVSDETDPEKLKTLNEFLEKEFPKTHITIP